MHLCILVRAANRQLRKLRTLAELRLAAVSSLQHCAITLVPYLDGQVLPPPACRLLYMQSLGLHCRLALHATRMSDVHFAWKTMCSRS